MLTTGDLPRSVRYDRPAPERTSAAPFSYEGEFYKFDDFGPGFAPYEAPIPISIGGQSDEAFAVGGAKADIFSFWGEPLDDLSSEIERVNAIARSSGRATVPRIWVTFRPIVAATDELAWAKAHEYVAKIAETFAHSARAAGHRGGAPQNKGAQRALAFADRSQLYDRALWTKTAAVTNAAGASTALVGSPETVAAAILDYVDRGASLVSIRGYDTLADAVDYGTALDQLTQGRAVVHLISGGIDAEQRKHGDYEPKARRYARTSEFIDLLRRAWTETGA